ncbi:hypothetical protein LXL04_028959 [Taraxacum kok-saghyz]
MLLLIILVLLTFNFSLSTPLAEGNSVSSNLTAMGKPGCQTECGNLTVKYPFGIGKGCFLDESFEVICNSTADPPTLSIGSGTDIQIYSISDSEMRIANSIAFKCYNESGVSESFSGYYDLTYSPFSFSQKNKLTVVGCDDLAWFKESENVSVDYSSGCLGFCSEESDVRNGYCSGIGCCQTEIPKGIQYYSAEITSVRNHRGVLGFNRCGFAFLSEEDTFQFGGVNDLSGENFISRTETVIPIVLDWTVRDERSCSQVTACKGNSSCNDTDVGGYRCSCKKGYDGNPYLDPGCQDIDECADNINFPCYGVCTNTPGSYNCTCFPGHIGDGTTPYGCRPQAKDSKFPVVIFAPDLTVHSKD